jgi:hypothetical protein
MPAGLENIVEASSAIAAPPAYALPKPLILCSTSANPAPNAEPADIKEMHKIKKKTLLHLHKD